jgi:hypothetical protein
MKTFLRNVVEFFKMQWFLFIVASVIVLIFLAFEYL